MPLFRRYFLGRKLILVVLLLVLLYCVRQVVKERTIMTGLADLAKVVPRQLVPIPTVQRNHSFAKEVVTSKHHTETVNLCPMMPPKLVGTLAVKMEPVSFEDIKRHNPQIKPGGRFQPLDCKSRQRVAIIVPYRDREQHLKVLLNNLHPILQRQQLDYGIYVIEMAMPTTFNRAILMNIGYTEALKDYDFQCFIFQDVDHIPENDKNLYNCHNSPSHLAVSVDKNNYKLPYPSAFGGVVSLTKEQMIKVNGWSNLYFGWGCEDDDIHRRIHLHGMKVSRGPAEIGRYKMVKHKRDSTNQVNKDRGKLLKGVRARMTKDGLNSLTYELLKREIMPLYAHIYVRIPVQGDMKSHQ